MRAYQCSLGSTTSREKPRPLPSALSRKAQKHSAESVARLTLWLRSRDAKISLRAVELLLAHAFGPATPAEEREGKRERPHQRITSSMTAQEAYEVYRRMLRKDDDSEKLPPIPSEVRKKAQERSPECVARLAYWLRSRDAKVSLKAAELLLAYGLGPVTPAEELETVKPSMTPQEAAEAYREMLRRTGMRRTG